MDGFLGVSGTTTHGSGLVGQIGPTSGAGGTPISIRVIDFAMTTTGGWAALFAGIDSGAPNNIPVLWINKDIGYIHSDRGFLLKGGCYLASNGTCTINYITEIQ